MPVNLSIKNAPDDVVQQLRERAARNHRSLQGELMAIIEDPNSKLAIGASFFPFTTPMLMTARLAVPPGIGLLQPFLGVLVVMATTLFCVYAAGRIFRVGILMQGQGARPMEMLKWIVRG